MSDLDYWVQFITSIAPALVSVIGVITSMIISVHKIKCHSGEFVKQSKRIAKANESIEAEIGQVIKDNAELKVQLEEIKTKLNKVHKRGK